MKISKDQLKQIIQEELAAVLHEGVAEDFGSGVGYVARKVSKPFKDIASGFAGAYHGKGEPVWPGKKTEPATSREKIGRTLAAINDSGHTIDMKTDLVKALQKQSGLSSTDFIKIVASDAAASGRTKAAEVYITNELAAGTIGQYDMHSRRAKAIVAKAGDRFTEEGSAEDAVEDTGAGEGFIETAETAGTGAKIGGALKPDVPVLGGPVGHGLGKAYDNIKDDVIFPSQKISQHGKN